MRILHLSDTHCMHNYMSIPEGIDIIIHSGDASNYVDPYRNEPEMRDFINWFKGLPAKYKIFTPGNHDTSIERGLIRREDFEDNNIIFLKHESTQIEGINIFGSPYTPSFGQGWAYNVKRDKLFNYWEEIPENTDILITHGPPMYYLDNDLGQNLGCRSLYKRVQKLPNLKIHQFGHIHSRLRSNELYINRGTFQETNDSIKFINASFVCLDHKPQLGHIISEIKTP